MTRRCVEAALPPWQLLPRLAALDPDLRPHALDSFGEGLGSSRKEALGSSRKEGWGTSVNGDASRSLLALEPEVELRGGAGVLDELQHWLRPSVSADPLGALAIGSLAYDLGREFERLPSRMPCEQPEPPVYMACFRAVYVWNPGRGEVVGSDPRAVRRLADLVRAASEEGDDPEPCLEGPCVAPPEQDFLKGVDAVREWIRRGDVYQVNLSRRLEWPRPDRLELTRLYASLGRENPAPFSAYLDAGDSQLVSNSPERFLRISGRHVETCPIKGTRPRGRTPEEDRWLAKDLLASDKDRAEHVMIVDLERNDLGRVCHTGSVHVPRLAELHSFGNVHHLVSSVQGELRDPEDWRGLLAATFPGGSITGAPKLRAMEIIEELEPVRRGVYTGSIGSFDASGGVDLSIAIRTAIARGSALELQLGGGVVAESDPESELRETQDKGRAFTCRWNEE